MCCRSCMNFVGWDEWMSEIGSGRDGSGGFSRRCRQARSAIWSFTSATWPPSGTKLCLFHLLKLWHGPSPQTHFAPCSHHSPKSISFHVQFGSMKNEKSQCIQLYHAIRSQLFQISQLHRWLNGRCDHKAECQNLSVWSVTLWPWWILWLVSEMVAHMIRMTRFWVEMKRHASRRLIWRASGACISFRLCSPDPAVCSISTRYQSSPSQSLYQDIYTTFKLQTNTKQPSSWLDEAKEVSSCIHIYWDFA